jgi:hypothetical protein
MLIVVSTVPLPGGVATGLPVNVGLGVVTGESEDPTGDGETLLVDRDVVHPEKHAARSKRPIKTHVYAQIFMMVNTKVAHISFTIHSGSHFFEAAGSCFAKLRRKTTLCSGTNIPSRTFSVQ